MPKPKRSEKPTKAVPELLSVHQLAVRFNFNEQSVYRYAAAGKLPHIRIGAALRFLPSEINAFIAAGGTAPKTAKRR